MGDPGCQKKRRSVRHMPMKEDVAAVKNQLQGDIVALGGQVTGIERELKEMRRKLVELQNGIENVSGFRQEIDHTIDRIATIEKHLGIERNMAA